MRKILFDARKRLLKLREVREKGILLCRCPDYSSLTWLSQQDGFYDNDDIAIEVSVQRIVVGLERLRQMVSRQWTFFTW